MRVYKYHPDGRFEPVATQDIKRASVGPRGEVMLRLDLGTHELIIDLRQDEVRQIASLHGLRAPRIGCTS